MDRQTQFNCGSLREIQSYPDGPGIRAARKFLSGLLKDFARWNKDFLKCAGLFPVTFRESQISGGLFSAILNSGAQALAQPPIHRKRWGVPEKWGWADFVAYFDDSMWFLEVKHTQCKLNFYKRTELEWLKGDWKDAVDKVKSFRKSALADWGDGWHTHFGAAFHVLLIYQQHKNEADVQPIIGRRVIKYVRSLRDELNPKPNWIWLWSLNSKLQEAQKIDGKWENYPAVCFLIYLKPLNFC
jgi:hypothetical protein